MRLVMINDNTFIIWEPIITSAREPLFIFLRHFRSRLFVTSTVIVKIVHNRIILILYYHTIFIVLYCSCRRVKVTCGSGPVKMSQRPCFIFRHENRHFPPEQTYFSWLWLGRYVAHAAACYPNVTAWMASWRYALPSFWLSWTSAVVLRVHLT